jgi:hypothetical protein
MSDGTHRMSAREFNRYTDAKAQLQQQKTPGRPYSSMPLDERQRAAQERWNNLTPEEQAQERRAVQEANRLAQQELKRAKPIKLLPASPKQGTDDAEDEIDIRVWPKLSKAALHGLAGEFATLATRHSEADAVAVMMTSLTAIGALMGRARFIRIGDTDHHARLMTAAVGATSRARKGTSWGPVRRLIARTEEIIQEESTLPFPLGKKMQITHGPLSTGEGLINAIRDGLKEDDKGIEDKRLLVVEGELGAALRAMQRQGNTLSMTLRTAWDGHQLAPLIKTDRTVASDPHICIVAHITRHELAALLASSDVWGGLANRFLWACVRRRATIPFPKSMTKEELDGVAGKLAEVIKRVHNSPQEMRLTNSAQAHWADVYPELSQDEAGLFGAATARAEAQTIRLALTFALIDGSDWIEEHHLEAGLAMWRYAKDSAAYLFGGGEVDPDVQTILTALAIGPKTQTDINGLFAGKRSSPALAQLLGELQEAGRVTLTKEKTGGAPRKVWSLTS